MQEAESGVLLEDDHEDDEFANEEQLVIQKALSEPLPNPPEKQEKEEESKESIDEHEAEIEEELPQEETVVQEPVAENSLEDEDQTPSEEPVQSEPTQDQEIQEAAAEQEQPSLEDEGPAQEETVAPQEEALAPEEEIISQEENIEQPVPESEHASKQPFSEEPMQLFHPVEEFHLDLTPSSRFILKVIAGPNTGAEFAVDVGKKYLIGTDTTTCDIIFHDLSVSREHARLLTEPDGKIIIEDLGSRNGVVVDQKRIKERIVLTSNSIVTVGTTSFFFIDKEAPQETIATPLLEPPSTEVAEETSNTPPSDLEGAASPVQAEAPEAKEKQQATPEASKPEQKISSPYLSGALVLSVIVVGFIVLMSCAVFSLSKSKEAFPQVKTKDLALEVQDALKDFSGVRYTFNRSTRQLFLLGHVSSSVENSELLYNLQALTFLRGVQNNVINDEAIWQETNLLLSKIAEFKGVSMHSPQPGIFVLSGYLKTEAQAADLMDYMNINFNYLDLLENRVVVEEEVYEEITNQLFQNGFGAVTVMFINGDLTLTGYIGVHQEQDFKNLLERFKTIPGVRHTQNYIVVVTPEQQVIDLSQRYPSRYHITGYSKHGDVNINVVINGRILMRGDSIDEMTITSIQPHAVFLEKDGLKYKIEYNK